MGKLVQLLLQYLAVPLLIEAGRGLVAILAGWFARIQAKWRKEEQLERLHDRTEALDDLQNAQTKEEFDAAQKRVVDSKPK